MKSKKGRRPNNKEEQTRGEESRRVNQRSTEGRADEETGREEEREHM